MLTDNCPSILCARCRSCWYCKASFMLKRMQSVMTSAARLVCVFRVEVRPHHADTHIAALAESGLPKRIEFKLAVMVHRCLHQKNSSSHLMPGPSASPLSEWVEFTPNPTQYRSFRRRKASPLCFDIIAPVFQPSAIELFRSLLPDCGTLCRYKRHVGIVNICFQETFEDPSPQSFFPWISCSACAVIVISDTIIELFFTLFFTIFSNSARHIM